MNFCACWVWIFIVLTGEIRGWEMCFHSPKCVGEMKCMLKYTDFWQHITIPPRRSRGSLVYLAVNKITQKVMLKMFIMSQGKDDRLWWHPRLQRDFDLPRQEALIINGFEHKASYHVMSLCSTIPCLLSGSRNFFKYCLSLLRRVLCSPSALVAHNAMLIPP